VLFGTAYWRKPGEFRETGVEGVEVLNLSSAFMLPFERWCRGEGPREAALRAMGPTIQLASSDEQEEACG